MRKFTPSSRAMICASVRLAQAPAARGTAHGPSPRRAAARLSMKTDRFARALGLTDEIGQRLRSQARGRHPRKGGAGRRVGSGSVIRIIYGEGARAAPPPYSFGASSRSAAAGSGQAHPRRVAFCPAASATGAGGVGTGHTPGWFSAESASACAAPDVGGPRFEAGRYGRVTGLDQRVGNSARSLPQRAAQCHDAGRLVLQFVHDALSDLGADPPARP